MLLRSVGTRARLVVQQNLQSELPKHVCIDHVAIISFFILPEFLQLPHYCDSLYLRCSDQYAYM